MTRSFVPFGIFHEGAQWNTWRDITNGWWWLWRDEDDGDNFFPSESMNRVSLFGSLKCSESGCETDSQGQSAVMTLSLWTRLMDPGKVLVVRSGTGGWMDTGLAASTEGLNMTGRWRITHTDMTDKHRCVRFMSDMKCDEKQITWRTEQRASDWLPSIPDCISKFNLLNPSPCGGLSYLCDGVCPEGCR